VELVADPVGRLDRDHVRGVAVPLLVVTIVGWTFEYYRGYFAR